MLRTKALRKIFVTTLSLFILLTVYSIPGAEDNYTLKTNLEIESTTGLYTNSIYLLNANNYLVKSRILLDSTDTKEQVLKILDQLIIKDHANFPNGLKAYIPEGTKVLDVICGEKKVTIDFSKEFLKMKVDKEKQIISGLVYSILDLSDVKEVMILVEGELLSEYPNTHEALPNVLTKDIGINKSYELTSRQDISKVVIYYLAEIDKNIYYVPVTKYVNDSRDKIKIIVEQLASSYIYENNLMSFLHSNVQLLDYYEQENVMFLNFNDYLFDNNDKVLEEVLYSIAYSVFDNYDVNMVMFEVNNKNIKQISEKDLP